MTIGGGGAGVASTRAAAVTYNIRYTYGTSVEEINGDLFFRAPNPPSIVVKAEANDVTRVLPRK